MLNLRLHESVVGLKGFLMRHHFEAAQPETSRPYISALTLGLAYFVGGFIPLIPYLIVARDEVLLGLWWSIGVMVVVLLVFGYVKTCVVRGWQGRENRIAGIIGGLQMLAIGTIAVGAAVGLVRAIEQGHRN
jgi:vacuolar iron transporter family protein